MTLARQKAILSTFMCIFWHSLRAELFVLGICSILKINSQAYTHSEYSTIRCKWGISLCIKGDNREMPQISSTSDRNTEFVCKWQKQFSYHSHQINFAHLKLFLFFFFFFFFYLNRFESMFNVHMKTT